MSKRRPGSNGVALQAAISLAFVVPAAAQPAPNASPQGGQVVAGSAAISAGGTTTTINQASNRAAINWRSFDVGSNQSVVFQQPGANSVTLNRVTGPDPSAIAGRISANGQLVITNPSGVMFHAGAQVNAQSVIVSAPGISNQNFMAGRMVFDQPASPNARIENAGTITVREAGLAALVAPSVANSGTITARLGRVVLGGAAAHTIDMYGDGLVSIDITTQVTQAPIGPGGKAVTALVTNTGTIAADGGTVQLTARAADGVVSTLVQAGGTIQANTVGGRAGQIEIAGTGGSVVIEGRVAAEGLASGTTGGSVVAAGSGATVVAPTARISASGRAGGGTVAVGTTLARARGTGPAVAGTSARTAVAAGAGISADATESGDGGRVTVLSTLSTTMDGAVTARGGPSGGNGGVIEVSGETGFRLTGTADTSAPLGALGTILLDPRDLTITSTANGTTNQVPATTDPNIGAASGGTTTDAYVTPAQIQALTGNVRLQATRDLVVASSVTYGGESTGSGGNLTLEAGRNLTVNSGVTITVTGVQASLGFVPGVLTLTAGASSIAGYDPAGTLTILGTINTSGLNLNAGTGGIALSGALTTQYLTGSNVIDATAVSTTGSVVQTAGSLITERLSGSAASVALVATGNQISAIGGTLPLTATAGGVTITTSTPLTVTAGTSGAGVVVATGQTISLLTDTLNLQPGGSLVPALSAPGGTVALQPYTAGHPIVLTSSATKPTGSLALTTAETALINAATLQLFGPSSSVTFGQTSDATIDLVANGNFGQVLLDTGGSVSQNAALRVNALSNAGTAVPLGDVSLANTGNSIPAIGSLVVGGDLSLYTGGTLTVSGQVVANGTLALTSAGNMSVLGSASVTGPNGVNLTVDNAGAGSLTIAGPVTSNRGTSLTAGTGGIGLSAIISPGQALQVATTGPLAQTGGGIIGGTLAGNAASVSLASRANSISSLSGFTVSGGDLLLVDSVPLQVSAQARQGGVVLPAGRTATFVTDYLTLVGGTSTVGGLTLDASGGTLAVAPYTAGGSVLLTSGGKPSTGLSVTTAELALANVSTLQLGGNSGTAPTAGAITVGQADDASIDLGALGITRLALSATGAVTQNAALGVTTLAGIAGSLALANAGNYVTELNGFVTTSGDLALHTSSGLAVSAAVRANGGAGNVTLSSEQAIIGQANNVGLLLAADIAGATVRFDTTDGNGAAYGINQTSGIVTAGLLTGAAGATLLPQANQITNLGTFTTKGDLLLTDARALVVTGAVASTGAVTLNARGITQTAASSITAPELDGSSTADTVLDSRLNAISGMGAFGQSAGNFTLVTSSPELDFGGSTGRVSAPAGSLTFVADRVGLVTQPASGTSISATTGLITFAPFTAGRPITVVNTNLTGVASGALTLAANLRNVLHADTLALGRAGYTGTITLGNVNEALDLTAFRGLQVQTTGVVTQAAGSTWAVSALTGTAGSISLPGSLPGNNSVTSLGLGIGGAAVGLTATAGALTVGAITNLTTYGPISATTSLTLSTARAAGLTVVGSLSAPAVTLLVDGALSQSAASPGIVASSLAVTAGSAVLPSAGNRFGTLMASVTGNLTLTDSIGLSITGGSTVAGTLGLTVAGAVTGGPIGAQALTGSATSLSLTASGNRIGALGPFTTTGGFTLIDGISLTVGGAVSDPAAIALNVTGDLFLVGSLSAGQGVVTLNATGSINQSGGAITAGTLTGGATGSAVLGQAGNGIATLAGFTTGGDFTLVDSRSLVVSAPVDPNTVSMTVKGDLTLNSSVTGGTVALDVTGAILEGPGGRIVANTLTSRAVSASLNGSNQIAGLGSSSTTTGFSLVNAGPLRVDGPVSDGRSIAISAAGPITLAGDVSAPAITLGASGDITQTGGTLTAASTLAVSAAGALTQSGGNLAIGTLSGVADSIDLGRGGSAAIGQIADLAATGQLPGTLIVVNNAALRISGTLSGRYASVTSAGSMVLADGVVIRTDGKPSAAQLGAADAVPGSNLSVTPGRDGRATLSQAGTATISPLSASVATLRIDLPSSGGTVTLNNLQAGAADLVLNLGPGTATGALVANNLTVLGTSGQATLSGTVRGLSGDAAAQRSSLLPRVDLSYTLNGCAISIASCTTLPLSIIDLPDVPSIFQPAAVIASAIASVLRPDILSLDVLDLSVTRDRDDPTLLLPNISDKDY